MKGLVKTFFQRTQGPDPRILLLLVGTPSALDMSLLTVVAEHSFL